MRAKKYRWSYETLYVFNLDDFLSSFFSFVAKKKEEKNTQNSQIFFSLFVRSFIVRMQKHSNLYTNVNSCAQAYENETHWSMRVAWMHQWALVSCFSFVCAFDNWLTLNLAAKYNCRHSKAIQSTVTCLCAWPSARTFIERWNKLKHSTCVFVYLFVLDFFRSWHSFFYCFYGRTTIAYTPIGLRFRMCRTRLFQRHKNKSKRIKRYKRKKMFRKMCENERKNFRLKRIFRPHMGDHKCESWIIFLPAKHKNNEKSERQRRSGRLVVNAKRCKFICIIIKYWVKFICVRRQTDIVC